MHIPTVSIIIPAHNAISTLAATCTSVSAQTFGDWECLIVDDGSDDDTPTYIQELAVADSRFRYIPRTWGGVSRARNTGIQDSISDILTFLDADDMWHPLALQTLLTPLQNDSSLGLTWGRARRFGSDGRFKPEVWKNYLATGNAWLDMLVHDFLPMGCFCVRRSALPGAPYFDPNLTHAEDRDFLLRTLKYAKAFDTGQHVLSIRMHEKSASRRARQCLSSEQRCMEKHLGDPDIPSSIRRRATSALAFRCAVIAAMAGKDLPVAVYWYIRSMLCDLLNINTYLLIFRWVWLRLVWWFRGKVGRDINQ